MKNLHGLIESNPLLRAALVLPVAIMLIFSFFNLSATIDPQRAMGQLRAGIVNLDEGMGPVRLTDRLLEGMQANLPFAATAFDEETAGRAALESGEVSALVIFPADFTRSATGGGPIVVEVVGTQHLSIVEGQLGTMLAPQLQAGMSAALGQAMSAMGRTPPQVMVQSSLLHEAPNQTALMAPAISVFAIWVASLVGAVVLYFATRPMVGTEGALRVASVRAFLPFAVVGVATFLLTLVICWLAESWDAFVALWAVTWLAGYAVTALLLGLVALFTGWALVVIVPLVFYQAALSGAQAPVAAIPDWLRPLGEALPFSVLPAGLRSVLIGGPDGGFVAVGIATLIIGVVLIFAGTYLWRAMNRPA